MSEHEIQEEGRENLSPGAARVESLGDVNDATKGRTRGKGDEDRNL